MLRELFLTPNGHPDPPDERCNIPSERRLEFCRRADGLWVVIVTAFQILVELL